MSHIEKKIETKNPNLTYPNFINENTKMAKEHQKVSNGWKKKVKIEFYYFFLFEAQHAQEHITEVQDESLEHPGRNFLCHFFTKCVN